MSESRMLGRESPPSSARWRFWLFLAPPTDLMMNGAHTYGTKGGAVSGQEAALRAHGGQPKRPATCPLAGADARPPCHRRV